MQTLVTSIHVITCVLIVLVVLVQSGKGAEISASFSGSSQTVFGSSGGANFFVRFTQGAAAVFFATSLLLTIMGSQNNKSVFDRAGAPILPPAPLTTPQAAVPPPATNPGNPAGQPLAPTTTAPGAAVPGSAPATAPAH